MDPRSARVTVGELAPVWPASRVDIKPATRHTYQGLLNARVLPRWGSVPIGLVRHGDVQRWAAELGAELSPSRTQGAVLVLGGICDLAVRDGRLLSNPCARVRIPAARATSRDAVDLGSLERLAHECGPHRTLVLVLGLLGPRFGEAAGLLVRDFDPLRGRLAIRCTLSEVGGKLVRGTPKSGRERVIATGSLTEDLGRVSEPHFSQAKIAARMRPPG